MTLRQIATTACWFAIAASFVLSFATWVALGVLAGFGALAVALPFCVDAYIVTSLATWLTPGTSPRVANLARWNLYAVGLASVLSQSAYHGAMIYSGTSVVWRAVLATLVGALPPLVASAAAHLRARAAHGLATQDQSSKSPTPEGIASSPSTPPVRLPTPLAHTPQATARAHPDMTYVTTPESVSPPASRGRAPARSESRPPATAKESRSGQRSSPTIDDVAALAGQGLSRLEIAQRLGASPRTVDRRLAAAREPDAALHLVKSP